MNHMILFILLGFLISLGIYLRTKAKIEQIKEHANRLRFFGLFSTLIGGVGLYYLIVVYKTDSLWIDLGAFFCSFGLTMICFLLASRLRMR